MVVIFCLLAADAASSSGHSWQRTLGDGVHHGILGVALVWIVGTVSHLAGDNFFRMIFLVFPANSAALIYVFATPFALVLRHASLAPREVAITITLVWLKLRNRLTYSALRTSLGFHFASNNNAASASHVMLSRQHVVHRRRGYQYNTCACCLDKSDYSTERVI